MTVDPRERGKMQKGINSFTVPGGGWIRAAHSGFPFHWHTTLFSTGISLILRMRKLRFREAKSLTNILS